MIKLRERGGGCAEYGDRQVPDGLGDLVAQDRQSLLLLAGDQDPPMPTRGQERLHGCPVGGVVEDQ